MLSISDAGHVSHIAIANIIYMTVSAYGGKEETTYV